MAAKQKRRPNPRQKRPLTRLEARPFPIRPSGPRGISSRPPKTGPPVLPAWFRGQYPQAPQTEWIVWWWLTSVAKKQPGVDFVYQDPVLGGRTAGGQVLDFVMLDRAPPLAIFVNGNYWHFGGSTLKLNASLKAVENVRQILHYDAIIVWESALQTELNGTMERALLGIEVSLPLNVQR